MIGLRSRSLVTGLLLLLLPGLLLPAGAWAAPEGAPRSGLAARVAALEGAAPEAGLRASEEAEAPLSRRVVTRVFEALKGAVERTLAAANRSDRVSLRLEIAFLDDTNRIFLDLRGTVRVKVPVESWRERFAEEQRQGRTRVLSSNGPVSLDLALTPLEVKGPEVTFGVQLDASILTPQIFRELVRAALHAATAVTISSVAASAADALASLDADAAGKALGASVKEVTGLFGADAGAAAYSSLTDPARRDLMAKLKPSLTPAGLLRHFALVLGLAVAQGGATMAGVSVGAVIGTSLLPAGAGFLAVLLATTAVTWFGSWAVTMVTVKLPIYWRLRKLGKLGREALAASGARREACLQDLEEASDKLAERVFREMDRKGQRWNFLELLIGWFASRVKDAEEPLDLGPYRPLLDRLRQRLQLDAAGGDWYAARMYYQLLGAIRELPPSK